MQNLKAFSDEGSVSEASIRSEHLKPFRSDVTVNGCLGWRELKRQSIIEALGPLRNRLAYDLPTPETLFGIAYPYIPDKQLEKAASMSQGKLFHIAGFSIWEVREPNWRGKGVLVDFCDIVPPTDSLFWDRGLHGELFHVKFDRWVQRALDHPEVYPGY